MSDRILIAGTHSGSGKTTVTIALLAALKARNVDVSAFKCGPDYLDPMFHREAIGIPSNNLDPFFSTGEQLCNQLASAGKFSVIEGVMGYYDGIGTEGRASSYHVAMQIQTPVVLVVDAKGMYTSAGAILQGFLKFKPDSKIVGVIFNNVSEMVYQGLSEIARKVGVKPLGFLPRTPEISIGSRLLGLISAQEISDIKEKLEQLGALAEKHIDIDAILALGASAPKLSSTPQNEKHVQNAKSGQKVKEATSTSNVRIAVAKDHAFCFIYQETLETLESMGCDLVYFSPIRDAMLPENIGGLYLPGGYPELHAQELSDNKPMLAAVKKAVENGLPTIAECGGFMYLHTTLDDLPMVNLIEEQAFKTEKLQRFGYVTLTAKTDNLLCCAGESIRSHEFHYYDSTDCGTAFSAEKAGNGSRYDCVHATSTLYAGFPHLYLYANPSFARNFVEKAAAYTKAGAPC